MRPLTGLSLLAVVIAALPCTKSFGQVPVDTTFTYQGQLKRDALPVSESCDFEFRLYNALVGGSRVGVVRSINAVPVTNGLFSVELNFGIGVFSGDQRFLDVLVQCPADVAMIPLTPRHALRAAPYASTALKTVGVDGTSLDAPNGGPINAVSVDTSGRVRMEKGGLAVFDDQGHGISLTTDEYMFNEGTSEDPVYDYSASNDTHVFYTMGARRLVIDADGDVGIGTETPSYTLHVASNGQRAIFGDNNAASGIADGVYGRSSSTSGHGVTGMATSSSGTTYGVSGRSYSTSGRAVYGNASASSGVNYGVSGQSWSTTGRGAHGLARATSGVNYGVYGQTDSTEGYAGYFKGGSNYFQGNVGIGQLNPAAKLHIGGISGTDGIMFPDGTLQTTASAGGGTGSSPWSVDPSDNVYYGDGFVGIGFGTLDLPPLQMLHVNGNSYMDGRVGIGTSAPDFALHVVSGGSRSILGLNTTASGDAHGVYGRSASTAGHGVTGMATSSSGTTYGVSGRSYSTSGRGVHGIATSTSGVNYGLYGETDSTSGYAGYFVGGRNYFEGNVGIGVLNPAAKLHIGGVSGVDGIMFPDGSLQKTAASGGGTSLWSESADGIFYTAGNVGIGITNSTYPLYVLRDTNANAIYSAGTLRVYKGLDEVGSGVRVTRKIGSSPFSVFMHTEIDGGKINTYGTFGDVSLSLNNESAGNVLIANGGGNVGIGTTSPTAGLHIGVDTRIDAKLGIAAPPSTDATLNMVSNTFYGIKVTNANGLGASILGEATDATGFAYGVYGVTSGRGAGVLGLGIEQGVEGTCTTTDGVGVYGHHSASGTGVYGKTTSTGVNYGVRGESASTSGYGGYFTNTSSDGTALYASSAGAGKTDATLQVHNTKVTAGMAAYLTSVGTYATMHVQNDGIGEVLWLSKDNASGEFIVAHNQVTGRRVFTVDQDGWTKVSVLEITGGADLSEQFDVGAKDTEVEPGMVVSIDSRNAGKLVLADSPYDRKVAGVVSGAGGLKPGMIMGQKGTIADGQHAVALTGRVWTWCDASNGAIQPGDLLTTSSKQGHAMKVSDHGKAQGAIIGKAMSSLEEGSGLVLILVSLQ